MTIVELVADHLWQSTLVAVAIAALAVLFRHHAGVRYGLWFAASLKFLVPFSVLVALGGYVPLRIAPAGGEPAWSAAVQTMIGSLSIEPFIAHSTAPAAGATVVDWRVVLRNACPAARTGWSRIDSRSRPRQGGR